MLIEIDKRGLYSLVKGTSPNYSEFDNPLVKKAGHEYSDQYGKTNWYNLDKLTDMELYRLYIICRDSW